MVGEGGRGVGSCYEPILSSLSTWPDTSGGGGRGVGSCYEPILCKYMARYKGGIMSQYMIEN